MLGRLKKEDALLISILLLAIILRLWGLNTRDIWYDEALSVEQAFKGWLQIARDVPTPLHYYIIKLFPDKIINAL